LAHFGLSSSQQAPALPPHSECLRAESLALGDHRWCMFKKQFAVQAQNLLSKKDLKGLRAQIAEQFPGIDEKAVDAALPEGSVKVLKLDNRCLLYQNGDNPPCFFDADGRGDVYPTLNMLWQNPSMMMELTIHGEVSHYVLKGADLMLQGVIVPANGVAGFGGVTKGQKRCIKIDGNPYAIAVGKMLVNQTQMEKLKGKGLEVCHVFKDALWAYGGKISPNKGFTEKEDMVAACADLYTPGAPQEPAAPTASASTAGPTTSSEKVDASEVAPSSTPAEAPTGGGKPASEWSQEDLLDFCFLQAFQVSLTDEKSLPVEASELYEKHMKPRRPEGTTLDVKKSSHKQIGKYLNAMRKAKVIDVNEKKGVISVTKIDRGHKAYKQLEEKFAADIAGAAPAAQAAATGNNEAAAAALPPPQITAMWKPSHYLESMFKAMGKSKSELYTWDQTKAVLVGFIEKEGLGKGDSGTVKLNEDLITALFRAAGAQKKDLTFPDEVDFSELEDKMQERMAEHTTIEVAGIGPTTRKGPALKIEVALSKKGAHNVTKITNLEAYGLDVQALGDELKKKLNCTVHIEDMPGKATKDKSMQLQGHVHQDFAEFVQKRYGITKTFMSIK